MAAGDYIDVTETDEDKVDKFAFVVFNGGVKAEAGEGAGDLEYDKAYAIMAYTEYAEDNAAKALYIDAMAKAYDKAIEVAKAKDGAEAGGFFWTDTVAK